MKRKLFTIYATTLAVISGLIVFHAPLSVGFGSLFPDYALGIKAWKEILLFPLAIIGAWLIYAQSELRRIIIGDWLFRLIGVYILLHFVMAFFFHPPLLSTVSGIAIDTRYVVFFTLVFIAIYSRSSCRRQFLATMTIASSLSLLFTILQVTLLPKDALSLLGYTKTTIAPFLTIDNNPAYIRINGTLRGPNPLGAFGVMVVSLVGGRIASPKQWLKNNHEKLLLGFLTAGGIVAIYASYARSALVGVVIAIIILGFFIVEKSTKISLRKFSLIIASFLMCLSIGIFIVRDSSFIQHVILHEDPAGKSLTSSNEGHIQSLIEGMERFLRQPLGAGPGSSGSASLYTDQPLIIENQYLFIAHEAGWLGLLLFITIFAIVLQRLYRARSDWLALGAFASGCALAAIGLFLPVWADDTVSMAWWAIAAIALATRARAGNE